MCRHQKLYLAVAAMAYQLGKPEIKPLDISDDNSCNPYPCHTYEYNHEIWKRLKDSGGTECMFELGNATYGEYQNGDMSIYFMFHDCDGMMHFTDDVLYFIQGLEDSGCALEALRLRQGFGLPVDIDEMVALLPAKAKDELHTRHHLATQAVSEFEDCMHHHGITDFEVHISSDPVDWSELGVGIKDWK